MVLLRQARTGYAMLAGSKYNNDKFWSATVFMKQNPEIHQSSSVTFPACPGVPGKTANLYHQPPRKIKRYLFFKSLPLEV